MKRIVFLLAVLTFSLSVAAEEPSAEKLVLIRELMDVANLYEIGLSDLTEGMVEFLGSKPTPVSEEMERIELEELVAVAELTREERPGMRSQIEAVYVPVLDALFSEAELNELIRIFRTDLGRKLGHLNFALFTAARNELTTLQRLVLQERKSRADTMVSMRNLGTALEAYNVDHDRYPETENLHDLAQILEPDYIEQVDRYDGWGRSFLYLSTGSSYRILSGGADRRIEPGNVGFDDPIKGSDDFIYQNAGFLQAP